MEQRQLAAHKEVASLKQQMHQQVMRARGASMHGVASTISSCLHVQRDGRTRCPPVAGPLRHESRRERRCIASVPATLWP
jgi:hypothetical protein